MSVKLDEYFDDTILMNVLLFIANRIKNGENQLSYILENGARCTQQLQPPSASSYSVSVDCTYITQPKDPEKPMKYHFKAMTFSGIQLTNSRVMITGECYNESDLPFQRFNEVWAEVLKAFGKPQPKQSENIIADNLGGTVTYKRNEQGQTIITGGTVNPGYYAELGIGAAIIPEGQIRLNHTTGSYQPGLYPPQAKDDIIRVTSETLAGLSGDADPQAAQASAAKRNTINLQTKPAGRNVEYYNQMAYDILNDGNENANKRAFEYWCNEKGIESPTPLDKKAFKEAMRRAYKRDGTY